MANPYNYPNTDEFATAPEYKINIMSGIYDKHFTMVNALYEFLTSHPAFDPLETYTIKKPIHEDLNGEKHFNFAYKGRTYHAYVRDVCMVINGRPHILRQQIYRLSVLEIIY